MERGKPAASEGSDSRDKYYRVEASVITADTPKGYEYLDHPADVQIHSWGKDVKEAFEQAAIGMFGYMTDLDKVEIDKDVLCTVEAEGHDLVSLFFNFLNEFLCEFYADEIISKEVEIQSIDLEKFKIKAIGRGEVLNLEKHPQGTEVKAITYSAMQVIENKGWAEAFVIIDI